MDLRAASFSVVVLGACNAGVAPPRQEMAQDVSQPAASAHASGSPLQVADLAGPVTGLLGKPLGLVVQVDATIAGVALAKPVVIEFSSDPDLGMPSHNVSLAEWRAGKGRGSLDDRELARIRDG